MLENRALTTRTTDDEGLLVPAGGRVPALAPAPAEVAPTSILTIIWRRRWIFLACVVLALSAAAVYLVKATKIYASGSQIYVQQNGPKIISDMLTVGGAAQNYLFTQCDMIRSTAILSSAIEAPEVRQTKALRDADNPVGYLKLNTTATVGKQSDVITVSVQTPYPEDSALLANAVVDAYISYQNKQQRTTAGEVLKILQKEKDRYDEELRATQVKMLAFKRENGMLSFENEKGNVVTQRLAELSNALTAAEMELLNVKVMMDAVQALGNDPVKLRQFIQSETAANRNHNLAAASDNSELWREFRRLQRLADQARELYGPAHAQVRAYERQLTYLQADMAELDSATVSNYHVVLQQQHAKARAKVDELSRELDQQRGLALDLNTKVAEYTQLESDARRAEKVLDSLDIRIRELNVSEDAPVSISILEVARPSLMPVKPKPAQTVGMALVLGLMLGLGGALLRDWMDQRLRSIDEIRAILDLPVLGIIPHMLGKQAIQERGQEVHLRPRSNVAEAYRTVRTAIYFGVSDPKSKTLLITSPSPGDGKSTLASNLAIAIAQSGRRVLLIDADMRKPVQHRIFGLQDQVGLASVLLEEVKPEHAIQRTGVETLDILPCGPIPSNPSEILNSQSFLDLINALCVRYDQIVIDSPPVEPVTDARILAASTDVTVLVLRAEKSTRRLSAHARDALLGVGANLLGVIVNDVPRGQDGYSYYSGYGYYHYGYGRSSGGGANGGARNGGAAAGSGGGGHKEIKAISVSSSSPTEV